MTSIGYVQETDVMFQSLYKCCQSLLNYVPEVVRWDVLGLLIFVPILVRLDCFSDSITMEV